MKTFHAISDEKLQEIIDNIAGIRVALIGDLCLDVYWIADMTKSELSRETPHFMLPVIEERLSPGAGGNTVSNIAALQPLSVRALGVIGRDWRADALVSMLQNSGINTEGVVVSEDVITNAFCKPIRRGISNVEYEDPRLDFLNYTPLEKQAETELLRQLDKIIDDVDVLCVSDQLLFGCITPQVRERINTYGLHGKKVVVDSRDRISMYKNVTLKPNEIEGFKAVHNTFPPKDISLNGYVQAAQILAKQNHSDICMTLGPRGCLYTNGLETIHVPARYIEPPIDFCGAGDTFLSAFSCALATGAAPWEAADFANIAAEVTIQKIGMTGTASIDEIRQSHADRMRTRHG